jgi:hypothetical protein
MVQRSLRRRIVKTSLFCRERRTDSPESGPRKCAIGKVLKWWAILGSNQ